MAFFMALSPSVITELGAFPFIASKNYSCNQYIRFLLFIGNNCGSKDYGLFMIVHLWKYKNRTPIFFYISSIQCKNIPINFITKLTPSIAPENMLYFFLHIFCVLHKHLQVIWNQPMQKFYCTCIIWPSQPPLYTNFIIHFLFPITNIQVTFTLTCKCMENFWWTNIINFWIIS